MSAGHFIFMGDCMANPPTVHLIPPAGADGNLLTMHRFLPPPHYVAGGNGHPIEQEE